MMSGASEGEATLYWLYKFMWGLMRYDIAQLQIVWLCGLMLQIVFSALGFTQCLYSHHASVG